MRRKWPKINKLDKSTGALTGVAIAVRNRDKAVFKNPLYG